MPSRIARALLCIAAALALSNCGAGLLSKGSPQTLPPLDAAKGRVIIYRTSSMGSTYIPDVLLNGVKIGRPSRPGVFFRDVPPGSYAVSTSMTPRVVNFALAAGEKKYVRLTSGFFASQMVPELVDAATGESESAGLSLQK